jgi:hypothetical protein
MGDRAIADQPAKPLKIERCFKFHDSIRILKQLILSMICRKNLEINYEPNVIYTLDKYLYF